MYSAKSNNSLFYGGRESSHSLLCFCSKLMQGVGRFLRWKRKPVLVELLALLRSDDSGLPRRRDFRTSGSWHMSQVIPYGRKFRIFAAEMGVDSLSCSVCCIAQLAWCSRRFFHLRDLIFVILRKWVLNVICQEAKQLCYFLSRLEFCSNNSIYQ